MVIVGAGEAGARAASRLRELGYAGPVTLIGDEPHGPYERPPLSKAVMAAGEDSQTPPSILDAAALAAQSITHHGGTRALLIDRDRRRVDLDDGRSVPYAKLLLATGAGPRRLATPGAGEASVLYLRTFADALALRGRLRPGRRLVVVGGGFIGLEIAASAVARGCAVTVLEMAPRLLMRGVPASIATAVEAQHRRAGVTVRTGIGLSRLERDGDATIVVLQDGTALPCDAVVAGIGAVPETQLAQASGLAIDNGVKVDSRLCTDDPHIFAAGDCCSFPHPLYGGRRLRLEAWRNAQEQGAAAARAMLGDAEAFAAVPWFWSDQYEKTLQVAGLVDEGAVTVERPLRDASLCFHLDAQGRLVAASGIGANATIARDMRLAEMLIARRATPDPASLSAPEVKLKGLLR